MAEDESYIDYEAFLSPSFSPTAFANALVLATNDPTEDAPLDLDTPLSKVLFDVQDIDTRIDALATRAAGPLLASTLRRDEAAARVLAAVEDQVATLTEAYQALEREVGERHGEAERVRQAATRVARTVRLARGVSRALLLGRQLQVQVGEFSGTGAGRKADHRAMVRAASTLAALRALLAAAGPGGEGRGLGDVTVITTLKSDLLAPTERLLVSRAQQVIREFSTSSLLSPRTSTQPTGAAPTFTQNEETKSRASSALQALHLLTSLPASSKPIAPEKTLAVAALQEYLQAALKASLASLSRALAALPTLDRALLEVSARCQNVVALQGLLSAVAVPAHPAHDPDEGDRRAPGEAAAGATFLEPLLQSLDTASLPSFFWRSLASALAPRVADILARGGAPARALRGAAGRLREAVRACVERGSRAPDAFGGRAREAEGASSWEREATVMVAAVAGSLGR
jgi:hypothetical protein